MKVFILNGPSASGKTALMDYLLLQDNDYLEPIVSFTTRPKRVGETEGRDYYYINREQYVKYCVESKVIEEINYVGNIYGITVDELNRVINTDKHGLVIMTIEGINTLKSYLESDNVVSIFIYRDLKDIIDVIKQRDSNEEEKNNRIELAKKEMLNIAACDHVLFNIGTLEEAYIQLKKLIKDEINKTKK